MRIIKAAESSLVAFINATDEIFLSLKVSRKYLTCELNKQQVLNNYYVSTFYYCVNFALQNRFYIRSKFQVNAKTFGTKNVDKILVIMKTRSYVYKIYKTRGLFVIYL